MMTSEIVLEVGGEGGSITLLTLGGAGFERFFLATDESTACEALSEEDREGIAPQSRSERVSSFDEALQLLDRHPWARLYPLRVHPAFRARILAAVRKRLPEHGDGESQDHLARWMAAELEPRSPAFPRMNTEAEIVRDVLERTRMSNCVADRIRFVEQNEPPLTMPTKEDFWRELVLALLTSQQRSTEGSALDQFAQSKPFALAYEVFPKLSDEEVQAKLAHFRFGKRIADELRKNYDALFGTKMLWTSIEAMLQALFLQMGSEPQSSHKKAERETAHLLSDQLRSIGPKQSRNMLQELGLTRYEIPLDSRVSGWLGENLGWNIPLSDLSDAEGYEFWLDRLQDTCELAAVLPTLFDAAAFEEGKTRSFSRNRSTCTGHVNRYGQVVVRNTSEPNAEHAERVYQLACSHCGETYGASGGEISGSRCPACQAS